MMISTELTCKVCDISFNRRIINNEFSTQCYICNKCNTTCYFKYKDHNIDYVRLYKKTSKYIMAYDGEYRSTTFLYPIYPINGMSPVSFDGMETSIFKCNDEQIEKLILLC